MILLFGGPSSERLVSFASAQNLAPLMPDASFWFWAKAGDVYSVSLKDIATHKQPFEVEFIPRGAPQWKSLEEALDDPKVKNEKPVFFLGLHGTMGEDGFVQRLLENRGYPFTGSGSAASTLAFDKAKTKEAVAARGVRVARAVEVESNDPGEFRKKVADAFASFGAIVVKPVRSGSSDGLAFISTQEDLESALQTLLAREPQAYLVEERIYGREITPGVVETSDGLIGLPATEVIVEENSSFDYAGKYLGKGTREVTPAVLTADEMAKAQEIAKIAHETIGCRGYSRTDLILDKDGFVFLEINTLPGLTKMSFIPQQLAAAGISLEDFIDNQLALVLF